ncbi:MAG TPA: methyltransferase domain-containing protein [Ignavibacteria bacterium]|nr:methyltransferase domain-containing protein [Ignavibacteria bacterium]HRJ98002.1 methyltransferase domain-containing protein [Ignavibacteria bacterium]
MQDRGWIPYGHEIDCMSAGKLSEKLGMEILCGDFLKLEIDKVFDAVIMLHVLEHLKDPVQHLNKISGQLRKGGVFFAALPNIESRSGLVKLGLEKLKLKRKNIAGYYDTEHHLWYYTPSTLRKLLQKNFDVITVYSGDRFNPGRSKLNTIIEEKIFSKLLWHSSMGVLAVKK